MFLSEAPTAASAFAKRIALGKHWIGILLIVTIMIYVSIMCDYNQIHIQLSSFLFLAKYSFRVYQRKYAPLMHCTLYSAIFTFDMILTVHYTALVILCNGLPCQFSMKFDNLQTQPNQTRHCTVHSAHSHPEKMWIK